MKKLNNEQFIAGCALAGMVLLFGSFLLGRAVYITLLFLVVGVIAAVLLNRQTLVRISLQSITSLILCLAIVSSLIVPAYASEEVLGYEEKGNGRDLLTYLRDELALCVDTYRLTSEMTDDDLANVYFSLDTKASQYVWENANQIKDDAQKLSDEEKNNLLSEENTLICLRFYSIMERIVCSDPLAISISGSLADGLTATGGNTFTWNLGTTISVTATPKSSGCGYDSQSDELILSSSEDATLTVTVGISAGAGSVKLNSTEVQNGNKLDFELSADGTKTLKIEVKSGGSENDSLTVTLDLVYKPKKNVTIAFQPVVGITYTVNETEVTTSSVELSADSTEGFLITTSAANYHLCSAMLVDANGNSSTVSKIDNKVYPTASGSLTPKFVYDDDEDGIAPFLLGATQYWDWDSAMTAAGSSGTVILNDDYTLPAADYTIAKGVTLLIPFDAAHTLITNDMENHVASSNDTQTLFRQLTMPSGTSITVNGAISISSRASRQMVGQVGPYGAIVMDEGSSISIENGAFLYAYGYIFAGTSGAGTITVKDGGTVYEDIMSLDYPGSLSSTTGLFNDYKIFPLRAFSIRNVEVPMTLNTGAKEYVFYCIYSGTFNRNFPGTELVISSDSSSPFQLKEGTTLTKSYSGGKQYVKINGSGGLNPLSVTLQGTTISSKDTTGFPIPSGFDIELASGTITMGGHVIMTEGSKITIGSEATVEANGKNFYVLDATEDTGAVSKTDVHGTQYTQVNSDAVLDVNGVLNAGATFYTSTSGACITSSKGGGQINIATAPADTKVYVKMSTSSQKNIDVTSAQLLNSNGGYVKTAEKGAGTYTYINGFWHKGTSCDGGTATCTAKAKCSTCGKEYGDLGKHTEVIDTATNPKWDAAGLTEGKHCSVCKTVIVKQQEIAAAKVGNEEYSILKEAINAADRSTPVTLLHNINGDVPVNKAVTIHKGDYTANIIAGTGFTLSEDASAKTATVLIRIMATNIVAGDGLDIYFYVLKSALGSETDYYAEAVRTRQGTEDQPVRIEGSEDIKGGITYIRFLYADIAAKEMTDTVTMSLRYSDGTQASNSYTESIKAYAIRTLDESDSSDNGNKLKTALMDMLNYGAAAQDYFGDYNIETLANAGSEVEKYASFATVNAPAVSNGLVKGDNLKAVSVSAKNKLMMTFYFANITQEMTAKISYEGLVEPIEIKGKDFFAYNSWYGVDVTGLRIADGRKLVTCEVYDGETLVASASDSVEGYVARNGSGVLVLQQLMKFVDSAYAYFR